MAPTARLGALPWKAGGFSRFINEYLTSTSTIAIAHELYLSAAARRVPQNNTLALLFVLCVSARDVAI
ncbi:hypothetical protein H633G_11703 [Metarhizium anisopliae BRIP 53284]|nr:hypothetical protein H633G_11703 [Metarhizium anisopliae BRIP 53284]